MVIDRPCQVSGWLTEYSKLICCRMPSRFEEDRRWGQVQVPWASFTYWLYLIFIRYSQVLILCLTMRQKSQELESEKWTGLSSYLSTDMALLPRSTVLRPSFYSRIKDHKDDALRLITCLNVIIRKQRKIWRCLSLLRGKCMLRGTTVRSELCRSVLGLLCTSISSWSRFRVWSSNRTAICLHSTP